MATIQAETINPATVITRDEAAPVARSGNYEPVRFNAMKHGILSRLAVLAHEDHAEFDDLLAALIDGGARLDRRNIWGDTAYSIAKADRYCGPDHPVTRMIRNLCYNGLLPPGDRCLASYELARRTR